MIDPADKPVVLHRWQFYSVATVKRAGKKTYQQIGGRHYNLREAWDFAREDLGYPRHQIRIIDHTRNPKGKWNLP